MYNDTLFEYARKILEYNKIIVYIQKQYSRHISLNYFMHVKLSHQFVCSNVACVIQCCLVKLVTVKAALFSKRLKYGHAILTDVGKLVRWLLLVPDLQHGPADLLHQDVRQTHASQMMTWSVSESHNERVLEINSGRFLWTDAWLVIKKPLHFGPECVGVKCSSHLFLCPITPQIDHKVGLQICILSRIRLLMSLFNSAVFSHTHQDNYAVLQLH